MKNKINQAIENIYKMLELRDREIELYLKMIDALLIENFKIENESIPEKMAIISYNEGDKKYPTKELVTLDVLNDMTGLHGLKAKYSQYRKNFSYIIYKT